MAQGHDASSVTNDLKNIVKKLCFHLKIVFNKYNYKWYNADVKPYADAAGAKIFLLNKGVGFEG
jgi:hypothetical protein